MISTENIYRVTSTIQSPNNPPTTIQWYNGIDHVQALAGLVQAGANLTDSDHIPESVAYKVLAVNMTIEHPAPEPVCQSCLQSDEPLVGEWCQPCLDAAAEEEEVPEYARLAADAMRSTVSDAEDARLVAKKAAANFISFDCETSDYALDDCQWWHENPTNRPWWARGDCSGRVGDTAHGVLCEHHFNAMPEEA